MVAIENLKVVVANEWGIRALNLFRSRAVRASSRATSLLGLKFIYNTTQNPVTQELVLENLANRLLDGQFTWRELIKHGDTLILEIIRRAFERLMVSPERRPVGVANLVKVAFWVRWRSTQREAIKGSLLRHPVLHIHAVSALVPYLHDNWSMGSEIPGRKEYLRRPDAREWLTAIAKVNQVLSEAIHRLILTAPPLFEQDPTDPRLGK